MLKLDKKYFWDIDVDTLDVNVNVNVKTHKKCMIARILERGNWPEFKALLNFYGSEQVRDSLLNQRFMDKKSHIFCKRRK